MYTQRQIWKVMRKLVSSNNSEIKRVFSSDVSYFIKNKYKNSPDLYKQRDLEKQFTINNGVRNIFRTIADKFLSYDSEAKEIYFSLTANGDNWQDRLSIRDLFYLNRFQNNILEGIYKSKELITEKSIISIIEKSDIDSSFKKDIVQFTGKPDRVIEDKIKIDIESEEVRSNTIEILEEKFLHLISKESNENNQDNMVDFNKKDIEPQVLGTFIGLDIQGSPLYENENKQITDCFGNEYNGQIFGLDGDEFVEIGSSEDGIIGPIFKFDEDLTQ